MLAGHVKKISNKRRNNLISPPLLFEDEYKLNVEPAFSLPFKSNFL